MGIFSSKKKIEVNVTVQPVFEEAQIPYAIKSGIIQYTLGGQPNLSDTIMDELLGCVGTKVNTGYGWAKKNDYAAGIPSAQVKNEIEARNAVMNVIANNIGQGITPVYYKFGPINSMHFGFISLWSSYGYNAETNEIVALSNSTGFPCYLKDMVATYTRESYDFVMATYDVGVFDQMGPSPKGGWTPSNPFTELGALKIGEYAEQPTYIVSDTAVDDYVTVTYEFKDADENIIVRSINIALTGISDEDFHQVRYVAANGRTGFFTYENGSGTYPAIDIAYVIEHSEALASYYPWAYFRVDNAPVDMYENTDLYFDCKKWCNYIGVDFDMISDGVHQDDSVNDVAQCILQIAVKPGDQNAAVIEYLFKHFSVLHENALSQMQLADGLADKFLAFSSSPGQGQFIQDKLFKQTLQFSGITRQRIAGKIGKVNTYTSSYGYVQQNQHNLIPVTPTGEKPPETVWSSQPAYIYRRQVLDSMYEEIAVYGLRIDYHVHHKKGFGAGAGQPELLVPVDREIARTLSVSNREQVICRGMHMLVNTVIEIKTPWYASGIMKGILLIVAVVITILSFGQAWQTIVAAAAIGTWAVVITVAVLVLQYIAVTVAIKLFVKAVGPKLGFVAAIAAMAVGAYMGFSSQGTSMWGERLMALGNGLAKQSQTNMNRMIQDVADDMLEFQRWAQGEYDSLREREAELGINQQTNGLTGDDLIHLVPDIYFGEAPGDYYARTVHSGNIGTTSYDMIEYYHAVKLQLPSITDTQEIFNGSYSVPEPDVGGSAS